FCMSPMAVRYLLRLIIPLFSCYLSHRDLHSFPTRRSSDLLHAQRYPDVVARIVDDEHRSHIEADRELIAFFRPKHVVRGCPCICIHREIMSDDHRGQTMCDGGPRARIDGVRKALPLLLDELAITAGGGNRSIRHLEHGERWSVDTGRILDCDAPALAFPICAARANLATDIDQVALDVTLLEARRYAIDRVSGSDGVQIDLEQRLVLANGRWLELQMHQR